jgi:hypothetical protein
MYYDMMRLIRCVMCVKFRGKLKMHNYFKSNFKLGLSVTRGNKPPKRQNFSQRTFIKQHYLLLQRTLSIQTSNIKHQTSNINTFSFQSNDTIKMHAHHISATVTDAIKTQHGRVRVRVREASERGTCTTKQQQKQKPMSLMMLNRVLKEHNRSGVRIRIRIRIQ